MTRSKANGKQAASGKNDAKHLSRKAASKTTQNVRSYSTSGQQKREAQMGNNAWKKQQKGQPQVPMANAPPKAPPCVSSELQSLKKQVAELQSSQRKVAALEAKIQRLQLSGSSVEKEYKGDEVVIVEKEKELVVKERIEPPPSMYYEELPKGGIVKCRGCGVLFKLKRGKAELDLFRVVHDIHNFHHYGVSRLPGNPSPFDPSLSGNDLIRRLGASQSMIDNYKLSYDWDRGIIGWAPDYLKGRHSALGIRKSDRWLLEFGHYIPLDLFKGVSQYLVGCFVKINRTILEDGEGWTWRTWWNGGEEKEA